MALDHGRITGAEDFTELKNALVSLFEAKDKNDGEQVTKMSNLLTEYSAKAEEHAKKAAAAEQLLEEQKGRIETLEKSIATKGKAAGNDRFAYRETDEYKAAMTYILQGKDGLNASNLDLKTLRTDTGASGGFLIPTQMDADLRKNITEISPFRFFARQRPMFGKTMDIPRRLANLTAYFEGEGEPAQTDQQKYGSEQVTVYAQTVNVPATQDMLLMSPIDMESEIVVDVGEAFAKNEGTKFLLGTGTKEPMGVISDTRVGLVDTTPASSGDPPDFDDFAKITGELKRGYNPAFLFNRRTLAYLFTLKSTTSEPLWQPVGGSTPPTIYGFPYSSDCIDLDDPTDGAGAKPVIFGDFRRGYEIYDLTGTAVVRDDYTQKKNRIVEWTFYRYLHGQVIVPEAIKIMRIA